MWLKMKDFLKGDRRRFNVYEMNVVTHEQRIGTALIGYDTRLTHGVEPGVLKMESLSRSQIGKLINQGTVKSFIGHSKR